MSRLAPHQLVLDPSENSKTFGLLRVDLLDSANLAGTEVDFSIELLRLSFGMIIVTPAVP
jgi:hypothetical protein